MLKHLKFVSYAAILCFSRLYAQSDAHNQLIMAYEAETHGRYDYAIEAIPPLIKSETLSTAERGRAWTLLGLAHEELGHLDDSQKAYESALGVFRGDLQNTQDYASASFGLARLYRLVGQNDMALQLLKRDVEIYRRSANYQGLAAVHTRLAELQLERGKIGGAEKFLRMAEADLKLLRQLTPDDYASLAVIRASICIKKGEPERAVQFSQEALNQWRSAHGDKHPLTAWGYLMLGKALAADARDEESVLDMRLGLSILADTIGRNNPKYLLGELAYARVLDGSGFHVDAARVRSSAEEQLGALYRNQCVGCTVSVATLR